MFTWYKRLGKYINRPIEVGFRFQKKLVFNKDTFDAEVWIERLERVKSQDFNRIKIPEFTYEIIDNEILFEIEFIKGRQLGATTFENWKDVIKEDLVNREDHWGFGDLKPENFIVEKNTDQLYFVDFESYYPMNLEDRIREWEKYLKIINLEIKNPHLIIDFENNVIKHSFWSS